MTSWLDGRHVVFGKGGSCKALTTPCQNALMAVYHSAVAMALVRMHTWKARRGAQSTSQLLATSHSVLYLIMQIVLMLLLCYAVIDGMDIVKKVEAIGSGDGKPSKTVHIADSGEITGAASAAA